MRDSRTDEPVSTDAKAFERAICARLRGSDRTALRELFRLLRDDLLGYAASIIRDRWLAHDLVQDVFVSLWDLRETLEPDCALRGYVYRMTRNRAYRHLRDTRLHERKGRELQAERSGDRHFESQVESSVDEAILRRHVRRWTDALPDRQREALVLSRFHGMSHHEVALVMGISARTVNNHLVRALASLHERMEALEHETSRLP